MRMRRHWAATAAALVLVLLAAGCSGGPTPNQGAGATSSPTQELVPPAEAADAPKLTERPAGRVVEVIGPVPDGIVADPLTHIVALGIRNPPRLALIDGRTGEVLRKVRLPGHVRHLQLEEAGGPVLVPTENGRRLLRVALPSGKVISRVRTGRFPHDATATEGGTIFVANEFGGTVAVVRRGKVVKKFRDVTQPAGLDAVRDLVGLVDVREASLTVYDATGLERVGEVPAGEGPTHLVADRRGRLVVVDTRGEAILVYALRPEPHLLSRTPLPGRPYGMAYDRNRDRLWVTLTAKNELVGLDMGGKQPKVVVRLPTVRQPNKVAVDSDTGRVFVTGRAKGVLQLIDPAQAT